MLLGLPLLSWGQSGAYTMASKKKTTVQTAQPAQQVQVIYVDDNDDYNYMPTTTGAVRDVDEYNRRGARYMAQEDSIYYPTDTTYIAVTQNQLTDLYSKGYNEGYSDGEDYALSRRVGRFGYSSIYCSPYYWRYYDDPFYWNDWYWGAYDPYWYGYYGWNRPYWGYRYYGPYRYGYYGGYRPYYYGGRPSHHGRDYVTPSGRRPGQTGRTAGYGVGYSNRNSGRNTGFTGGRVLGGSSSRSYPSVSGNRSVNASSPRSSGSSSRSTTYSGASSRSGSSTPSYSGSTRSSSSFGGSSRSSGGSFGGSRSSGGGGGFTGGSRGGGSGRGR